MRFFSVFLMGLKQKLRDRFGLLLTLLTAPMFVVLYWFFFSDASTVYPLVVLTPAEENAKPPRTSDIIGALSAFSVTEGDPFFKLVRANDEDAFRNALLKGDAVIGLTFGSGFASALQTPGELPEVTLVGDASSPKYRVSAAVAAKVIEGYVAKVAEVPPVVRINEKPMGLSGIRTPFEVYVPGLLVFAVIMLIFSSSMAIAKEVETGTLARIRLTPVHPLELLLGLSAIQFLVGVASVLLTLSMAFALGFRSHGSLLLAMSIAVLASMATVGIGMVVASLAKSQTRAFLIASIAMFLLILFSGIIFPRPAVTVMTVAGQKIDLFDLLPTTHMGGALEKVMTLGAGVSDITYELLALFIIGTLSFALGGVLFSRSGRPSTEVWEGLP